MKMVNKITREKRCQGYLCATTSVYLTAHYSSIFNMVKYRRNVNFEEIHSDPSTGKNDGF